MVFRPNGFLYESFLFISVVILVASDQEVAELMNAVKRIGAKSL